MLVTELNRDDPMNNLNGSKESGAPDVLIN